jgi:hypothetical protein
MLLTFDAGVDGHELATNTPNSTFRPVIGASRMEADGLREAVDLRRVIR